MSMNSTMLVVAKLLGTWWPSFWFQPAISFGGNDPKASQKGQHPLLFLGLLHVAPGHSGGRVDHERLFLALIFLHLFEVRNSNVADIYQHSKS